jgi:hypothetical protein
MKGNQKYLTPEGIEYAVFPQEVMTVTQNPDGAYSHAGTQNLDIAGLNAASQPAFAMVTCQVIAKTVDTSGIIFESVYPVLFAAGYVDYLTYRMYHDNNTVDTVVGQVFKQGFKNYDEGVKGNATGNHIHLCVARGKYKGMRTVPSSGKLELINAVPPWEAMFINDTIIKNGGGNPWKEYRPMTIKKLPTSTVSTKLAALRYRAKPSLLADKLGLVAPFIEFPCLGIVENIEGYHWAQLIIGEQIVYAAISKADGTSKFLTITEIPMYKLVESPVDATLIGNGFTVTLKRP